MKLRCICEGIIPMAITSAATAQHAGQSLQQQFENPRQSTASRTFWYWTNRLIVDQDLLEEKRILDAQIPRFGPQRTLKESGLMGPVSIEVVSADKEI